MQMEFEMPKYELFNGNTDMCKYISWVQMNLMKCSPVRFFLHFQNAYKKYSSCTISDFKNGDARHEAMGILVHNLFSL